MTGVTLGPLRRDLLPQYQRWVNDFTVMTTFVMKALAQLQTE